GFIAACMPQVPPSPQVVVEVTVIDADEDVINEAVAAALTSTASPRVALTETALAEAGITLTPTATATGTATPLPPTATPFISPTPTPTATVTPYPSNTPDSEVVTGNGQIRIVNAWRSRNSIPVDAFIDELPVAFGMEIGQSTPYFSVGGERTVRVLLIPKGNGAEGEGGAPPPIVNQLVEVPAGGSITLVLADIGNGPEVIVVQEDISALATGQSRLTFVHASAGLIRVDVLESVREVVFGRNLGVGEMIGPFDIPSGSLALSLNDTENPDQTLVAPVSFEFISNATYLVVAAPGSEFGQDAFSTEMLVFQGATRITATDTPVRFVNASPAAGRISIFVDDVLVARNLGVGEATIPLPLSRQSSVIRVVNSENRPLM